MYKVIDRSRLVALIGLVAILFVGCSNSPISSETVNDPNVLYYDDFSPSNVGRWRIEGDYLGSTAIEGEQLTIEVKSPNTIQYATLEDPAFSDFELEVDATLVDGASNSTFGVLFRIQDSGEFYRFELMNDGHYMIERFGGEDNWIRLVDDWTFSESIVSGGVANRMKVIADGPSLSFYVNGDLLKEVTDTSLVNGYIGLDAGTYGSSLTVASFDNLVLSNP